MSKLSRKLKLACEAAGQETFAGMLAVKDEMEARVPGWGRYHYTIQFDGGTPVNSAKRGFGDGYGSFCVNSGMVHRRSFGRPMSNNVAEVHTLIAAIKFVLLDLKVKARPETSTVLHVVGDSMIALNRCHKAPKATRQGKAQSPDFLAACGELYALCRRFHKVATEWRGREASVRLFGH